MNQATPYSFGVEAPTPWGLGASAPSDTQILSNQVTAAAAAVGGTIGTAVGGPALGALVAGSIQAAGAIANMIEGLFAGCGQTCVQATNIANQVATLLTQNVQNYINLPVRTLSAQAAALATFDKAWAQLMQACGNPALGAAGQRCVTDRQRGACTWMTSPGGWQNGVFVWPGAAGSGSACWNWFVGMRDPIANDPTVIPDPDYSTGQQNAANLMPGTFTAGGTTSSSAPGGDSTLLVMGVLAILAAVVFL